MTKLARHISLSTVCSRQEAPRWCDLGFDAATVIVTGDPRDDYVVERALDLTALEPLRVWAQGKRLMIAGSTHPADERCLLEALNGQSSRDALVLVPHESHPTRTRALLEAARDSNVAARVWREGAPVPECRALVITRPGMLQDLYALADIAFVGGGFDQSGVHSMAEAAAFAVPIIVGAHGTRSMECRRFLTATGATVVSDARHLAAIWRAWSEQPDVRARIGLAARRGLTAGASSRTVAYLLDMLAGR
jgi:3-deoxy-D-manno-octulosonic-acid transferase